MVQSERGKVTSYVLMKNIRVQRIGYNPLGGGRWFNVRRPQLFSRRRERKWVHGCCKWRHRFSPTSSAHPPHLSQVIIVPHPGLIDAHMCWGTVLFKMVVDAGVLECIDHVIRSAKSLSIEKECCWLLSNVIAGTHAQIQAVLDARLLPTIFTALRDVCFTFPTSNIYWQCITRSVQWKWLRLFVIT